MKYHFISDENDTSLPPLNEEERLPAMGAAYGLMLTTILLVAFGLTMLYSASSGDVTAAAKFFRNQLLWSAAGVMMGTAAFCVGYRFLTRNSLIWLGFCAILLIWAAKSREINGARRWIHFGSYTFQPSELTKVAVALFVAHFCSEHNRTFNLLRNRYGILYLGGVVGMMCLLIVIGHDLGTTLLVAAMAFFTMIVAGLRWYYAAAPAIFIPLLVLYIRCFDQMRWLRMTVFLDPETYQKGAGYQLWLSFLALGSGSWNGVGLMASRLKAKYLPEAHTDFILSIVGEELGIFGIAFVLMLYTVWGFFAIRITRRSQSRSGILLGWALTIGIMLQAAINLGVISGMFPTKGMPAPFISYGGSNLLCCLLATGILVSIAAETDDPDYCKKMKKNTLRLLTFGFFGREEEE